MHWRRVLFWKHYKRWKKDSVVLITGASGGIGKQLSLEYSKRKCKLVLAARSLNKLKEVAKECIRNGSEVVCVKTDVSKEEDCKNLIEKAIGKFGRLDILVLNAGIGAHNVFEDTEDLSIYKKCMDVNFYGYLYCCRYAMPYLRKTKGMIVVVSSVSGEVGTPYRSAYCASKFAVTGFFESLRSEMLFTEDYLDIVIVCPPSVASSLRDNSISKDSPLGRTKNNKAISVEKAAEGIINSADRRYRKTYLTASAFFGVYLRPFVPDIIDSIYKKSNTSHILTNKNKKGVVGVKKTNTAVVEKDTRPKEKLQYHSIIKSNI